MEKLYEIYCEYKGIYEQNGRFSQLCFEMNLPKTYLNTVYYPIFLSSNLISVNQEGQQISKVREKSGVRMVKIKMKIKIPYISLSRLFLLTLSFIFLCPLQHFPNNGFSKNTKTLLSVFCEVELTSQKNK